MKILYLTCDPPLDPERVATGNQVRAAGIRRALEDAGHQVLQHWRCSADGPADGKGGPGSYASAAELASIVAASGAGAILAGYWELLEALPDHDLPVMLDFIAPRLLEAMYQGPGDLQYEGRHLLRLLPRADHFLVGNGRQADFLLPLLLLAGFDCRERAPISVLPISVSGAPRQGDLPAAEEGAEEGSKGGLRLVSAGVDWPWRRSRPFLEAAQAFCREREGWNLLDLSGAYPYPGAGKAGDAPLLPYGEMQRQIAGADIGLELGLRNTEREFSHSFRLAEYLQQGLPVILNSWLPAARLVLEHDAGWTVDSPAELQALLGSLAREQPVRMREILREKAAGASRLASGSFNYSQTSAPLLEWLAQPWRPGRDLPLSVAAAAAEPPALKPAGGSWRRFQNAAATIAGYLLARGRPANARGILVMTRGDLFPADHGAAVKILRTAEALSRQGRDVWLCTDDRREYFHCREGEMRRLRYPLWLRCLALPRRLALVRLLLRGVPLSDAFLYFPLADPGYVFRVLYLGARLPVGAWLAEFPAYVRPCRISRKLFGGRVVLVEHNVEYERIRRQAPGLTDAGYRYLKRLELTMCQAADAVITVSDNDRRELLSAGVDARKLRTVPHGVDLRAFQEAGPMDVRERYGIPQSHTLLVYHGVYGYAPNFQAMEIMARSLLPRLEEMGLEVSVLAVGGMPPPESLHPRIHFTGSIERLQEVLPAADLAVVPLREGGGTRMKILDYFAAGVPVISTAKGIEGIPVKHGTEALILDDDEEICRAVQRLVRHPEEAGRLAANARRFVRELDWESVTARYLPLLFGGVEEADPAPMVDKPARDGILEMQESNR